MALDRPVLPGAGGDAGASDASLSRREVLGRRLLLNGRVRAAVGAALLVGPWIGVATELIERRPALILGAAALGLMAFNAVLVARVRAHLADPPEGRRARDLHRLVFAAVAADYVVLALAVALLGGVRSPVTLFYLLHAVLGNVLLERDGAVSVSVAAYALICFQAWAEALGIAPEPAVRLAALALPLDSGTAFLFMAGYGALFILTDALMITLVEQMREGELELWRRNRRLGQLSRLRQDFLRVAVHNMRAPVGASQMLVENLVAGLAGPLTSRQHDWVLRVGRRLEGLQGLLNDLQWMGQVDADEVQRRAEEVPMGEVLRDVCEDYGDQARAAGLHPVVREGEGVPPVVGIRRLLREAVVNYVTNAIKYAPGSGELVLRTEMLVADRGPWVRVEVRDRGPGVPTDDRSRLFQEFSRGRMRDAGPEDPASSGLGLAITRRIVESHDGRVGIDEDPGGGAAFWMELPSAAVARRGSAGVGSGGTPP